jgi:predicted ribosome quality control (RQC) complex YloA/Tae2 family protein
MHVNHFILKNVAKELNKQLANYKIVAIFSQNKNELLIEWYNGADYKYILAHLLPDNTFLSFPSEYKRARNNTADVLPQCVGLYFKNCFSPTNERILAFELENNTFLVITLFKPKPNVFIVEAENVHSFIKTDHLITPQQLKGKDFSETTNKAYGKEIEEEIKGKSETEVLKYLEKPLYFICKYENKINFSVFECAKEVLLKTDCVTEALTFYASKNHYYSEVTKHKNDLITQLSKQCNKLIQQISKLEKRLETLENDTKNKETADLIMANLHAIQNGSTSIEVYDFYNNTNRIIDLSATVSPQKQAEKLYSKEKNKSIEVVFTKKSIAENKNQLAELIKKLDFVKSTDNLREIIKYETVKNKVSSDEITLCKEAEIDGYKILIGKNAKNNEIVSFQLAKKDDIWLHARSVAGSHVVIKKKNNQEIPKKIIERAAEMAAFYSKAKNETHCPVIYTEKKYIRKLKGGHAGQVIVEKENVIIVSPKQ